MEGLIPFLCRSIKRKKTRMYYKVLSSGNASRWITGDSSTGGRDLPTRLAERPDFFYKEVKAHRRHNSMVEHSGERFVVLPEARRDRPPVERMMRSWSMRMLGCIRSP